MKGVAKMEGFMNTINNGITAESIWSAITPTAGLVVVLVLTAFGAYILNKNLRSARKNRGGKVA